MFSYPKTLRLRHRGQYARLRRNSLRWSSSLIRAQAILSPMPTFRFGITVTKKFGNACQRNAFKRKIREAIRLRQHSLPSGIDFVISPIPKIAPSISSKELQKEVDALVAWLCHCKESSK